MDRPFLYCRLFSFDYLRRLGGTALPKDYIPRVDNGPSLQLLPGDQEIMKNGMRYSAL